MADTTHLLINGREKLRPEDFEADEKLYFGFDEEWVTAEEKVKLERIRFPNCSCNWARFSFPYDVRARKAGCESDGCYAITVAASRFKNFATSCHDPLVEEPQNYAHVELRALKEDESIYFEPPKERQYKGGRRARLEYRQNILNSLSIELAWGEEVIEAAG